METHRNDPVRFRPKYYLATNPRAIIYVIALMLFVECLILAAYLYFSYRGNNGRGIFLHIVVVIPIISALAMLTLLDFVRLDEDGITYYPIFQRKKRILWKNVVCSGDFYHNAIMNRGLVRRRFFFFSTKPIPGGVDYMHQVSMPRATDAFVFVADQRDVERVIRQFVPKSKFCCTIPLGLYNDQ